MAAERSGREVRVCNIPTASFRWTSHREAATLKKEKRRKRERERNEWREGESADNEEGKEKLMRCKNSCWKERVDFPSLAGMTEKRPL